MPAKGDNAVLSPEDYEALSDLRYALRKFTEFSVTEVLKLGLTSPQHQVLLTVKGRPRGGQVTCTTVAERLLISKQAAVDLVNTLVEAGLVELVPNDRKGMQPAIKLVEKAEIIMARLSKTHLHEIREMAPELVHALRMLQDRRRLEKVAWLS